MRAVEPYRIRVVVVVVVELVDGLGRGECR